MRKGRAIKAIILIRLCNCNRYFKG